jgi:hypothetical protein
MILHTINAILVLSALIAIFVSHKASSLFNYDELPQTPNAVSPSGYRYYRYDSGTFDLETWTCELKNAKAAGEAREDYRKQCDIEVVGRTIVVPFSFVALVLAGMSVWAFVVAEKQGPRSEHLWTKDLDLEVGKADADGKHVKVEEVELATFERLERQKNGRLSKIEEDEQEAEEAQKEATTTSNITVSGESESPKIGGQGMVVKTTDAAS